MSTACRSSVSEKHCFFFFQAEDGIRDLTVTGVQTCALPICANRASSPDSGAPTIIDSGHARALDLAIEILSSPLEAVMAGEGWGEVYDRVGQFIGGDRTTGVFVKTRRVGGGGALDLPERARAGDGG